MKILLTAFVIVFALVLIALAVSVPSAEASPLYQETATPTVTATPPYVIENTVSVGEYGIATILSAQCLLLIVMATGAALWGFMQKKR